MNISEIIKNIGSVREFKKKFSKENLIDSIVSESEKKIENDVKLFVFKNGEEVYEKLSGKAGYFGNFIKAPIYFVFLGNDYEKIAYATEMTRFIAFDNEIGTCWITVNDIESVKKELSIEKEEERKISIIALGDADAGFMKFNVPDRADRNSATEIVFIDKWGSVPQWEDLEQLGFEDVFFYTRFAPSYGNSQPWKFILSGDLIILTIEKSKSEDIELNSGLVSFYFENGCKIAGYNIKKIDKDLDIEKYNIPDTHIVKKVFSL